MGKSRLTLLHIHYDMDMIWVLDLDEVITRYAQLHLRRLELDSLIRP